MGTKDKKEQHEYYFNYTRARKEYPNSGTRCNKSIKAESQSAAMAILKTFIGVGEILKDVKVKKLK